MRHFPFVISFLALAFISSLHGIDNSNEEETTEQTTETSTDDRTTISLPDEITRDHTDEPVTPLVEMYYWESYPCVGPVPSCAIKGGVDYYGNATYIGKARYNKYITSVIEIYPARTYAAYVVSNRGCYYPKRQMVYSDCKILCTDYPQQFEWIETKFIWEWAWMEQRLNFVDGGISYGWPIVVGKEVHNKGQSIGAVYMDPYDIKFTYYWWTWIMWDNICRYKAKHSYPIWVLTYTDICPTTTTTPATTDTTETTTISNTTSKANVKNPLSYVSTFSFFVGLFF